MEKRVFLTVAICFAIFFAWQKIFIKPYIDAQQQYQQKQAVTQPKTVVPNKETSKETIKSAVAIEAPKKVEPQVFPYSSVHVSLDIDTKGGVVKNLNLEEFQGKKTQDLNALIGGSQQLGVVFNSPEYDYLNQAVFSVYEQTAKTLNLKYEDEKVKIEKKFSFSLNEYFLDHTLDVEFKAKSLPSFVFVELKTKKDIEKLENENRNALAGKDSSVETYRLSSVSEQKEDSSEINWVGVSSRYFISAVVNRSEQFKSLFQVKPAENGEVISSLAYKVSAPKMTIPLRYYFGPKDIAILKYADQKLGAAVDFGWFTFFAYPLLQGLKWLYGFLHNYGLAIIFLTILVKLLTYPLTFKSVKSMKEMQKIQPQIAALKERFGDDKEGLNKEMITLMKTHGYNPLAGCLPIFIQMPVFIALYNVLYNSTELYGQPFFGWIADLSQKDPYYVTPVLLAVVMFVQQKMTPATNADPAQQKVMNMMPIIFGAMMLWLPAGLTLYMLVNSVVSILQQGFINRTLAKA